MLDEVIEMREEMCPECQGTGYVMVARDYYSASYGYYLQDERPVVCRTCGGTGYVEVWEVAEGFGEVA